MRIFEQLYAQLTRGSYGTTEHAAGGRDLRLDLIRGFCVFVMVIDHIGGKQSWLYLISGGNHFFVSAAEGFVFISGVTMGTVYAPMIARQGIWAAIQRVLRRARTLYFLTVGLTLVFALFSHLLDTPWSRAVTPGSWYVFVLGVVTLHRSFSLTDVLLLYTLLVLAAAGALYLLHQGRTLLLLGISITLWALFQVEPDQVFLPWGIVDGGFPFSAWQVLFMVGLAIGYHRPVLARTLRGRRHDIVFLSATFFAIALIGIYITELRSTLPLTARKEWVLTTFFDKNDLRIGRLLALAGIGTFAYTFATLFWTSLRRVAGWLLLPAGHYSLAAYTFHLFLVAIGASWIADPLRSREEHAVVQLIALTSVWLFVRYLVPAYELRRPQIHQRARAISLRLRGVVLGALLLAACTPGGTTSLATPSPTATAAAVPTAAATPSPSAEPYRPPAGVAALQQRSFASAALGRTMPYTVVLPPGYNPSAAIRYPVLYLLHGMSGSNSEWLDYGLQEQVTALSTSGAIIPMLIVLPQGDQAYWVDHVGTDRLAWGTYTAVEVVREIDTHFPTIPDREARAVGGLSMGAHGAVQLAINFPNAFGIAGAHSITLRTYAQTAAALPFFGTAAQFAQRDPILLAQAHPDTVRSLDLEFDSGDLDPWLPRAIVFDQTLTNLGLPHLFRSWPGGHDAAYWGGHLPDDLAFYSASFCGRPLVPGKPTRTPKITPVGCARG
ncbi:MAG: hypothetical protein NVS1B1_00720 [Candidatus Limnocylindrales bacterium]